MTSNLSILTFRIKLLTRRISSKLLLATVWPLGFEENISVSSDLDIGSKLYWPIITDNMDGYKNMEFSFGTEVLIVGNRWNRPGKIIGQKSDKIDGSFLTNFSMIRRFEKCVMWLANLSEFSQRGHKRSHAVTRGQKPIGLFKTFQVRLRPRDSFFFFHKNDQNDKSYTDSDKWESVKIDTQVMWWCFMNHDSNWPKSACLTLN